MFLNDLDVHGHSYINLSSLKNQQKFTILVSTPGSVNTGRVYKSLELVDTKNTKRLLGYSKRTDRTMTSSIPHTQLGMERWLFLHNSHNRSIPNQYTQKGNTLNTLLNTLNINFLRKEKLYTKLKYSRSPAYDIVSGGAAALLAGFIGFLISEKFGYELVDSGDFYYLFMYIVFLVFSVKPLLTVADAHKGFWDAFSLKRIISFYVGILQIILKRFK